MPKHISRWHMAAVFGLTPLLTTIGAVRAAKVYDPGVSDTEISLGATSPYSRPA